MTENGDQRDRTPDEDESGTDDQDGQVSETSRLEEGPGEGADDTDKSTGTVPDGPAAPA